VAQPLKIAILSDIHGNLAALEAVMHHARGKGAGQIILNLGDMIGYGPNPDEIIRWAGGTGIISIQGDYDKKVLSKKHRQQGWSGVKNLDKRAMFAWTFKALSKPSRKFIKSLPKSRSATIGGFKILLTHSGPGSKKEYLGPDTKGEHLEELAKGSDADIILSGHSHHAFTRQVGDALFINPGSVGRPDDGDPRASYALLEISKGQPGAQLFRVPYNINAAVQAMKLTGLPLIFTQVIRQGLNYDDCVAQLKELPQAGVLEPNGILTLLTDFGITDHFTGVMKGVILKIAPHAKLVDISHTVEPQNILQAARLLAEAVPFFPPGTVHLAVVDPGVGTDRRSLAARVGDHFFVAPDNGLLTLVIQKAEAQGDDIEVVALNQPKYWLPSPSHSFHGRDIFAPAAAHLVNGLPIEKLGDLIKDPILLEPSPPQRTASGWQGEVVMVDTFGNLSTNLTAEHLLGSLESTTIEIQGHTIRGLNQTFGKAAPGTLIATIDSSGALAIAAVNGSAQQALDATVGTPVILSFNSG
jgi:putative phosphoesterase